MKIKEIKIVNQDQSTEVADIGADAINVDYNNTTVKDELDKLNTTDDSLRNTQNSQGNTLTSLQSQVSSLASGGPAGVYATVAALTSADPNHSKIYIVTENGHWYYYNNGWKDGGQYLANIEENKFLYFNMPLTNLNYSSGWIRNSDHQYFPSDATKTYLLKNNNYSKIRVFLKSDTNVINGITFYSSEEIDSNHYISSIAWAGSYTNGKWYEVNVPSNANLIAITSNTQSFSPKIILLLSEVINTTDTLYNDKIENNTEDIENLTYSSIIPLKNLSTAKGWVLSSTGVWNYSDSTISYLIKNNNISKIKAFLKSDTNQINAISYYSEETISTDAYISGVSWAGMYLSGKWYTFNIPANAKLIVITTNSVNFTPEIQFLTTEIIRITDNLYSNKIDKNTSDINNLTLSLQAHNTDVFNLNWRDIYHFGMDAVAYRDVPVLIPPQSIFDVEKAKNYGYKCIEANCHKTSDNHYVVTHGIDGGLGHDFNDSEEKDAYGISISGNTLAYLQENYHYRSTNEKYRVPITTLEDFLGACKKHNMYCMLQYVDSASVNIAKSILGNRLIIYGDVPRSLFQGPILEWLGYTTKEEIINRASLRGAPYIYSMSNPGDFSDETLADIIKTLHSMNCYLASAYLGSSQRNRLLALGIDFIAVDGDVYPNFIFKDKKIIFNQDGSLSWTENIIN